MVLDIPRSLHGVRIKVALELLEQLLIALPDDVDQDVEPVAVSHADHDQGLPGHGGVVDDGVDHDC
ncbi:MAG TPA: hypothetical protein VFW24_05355 [Acidimicrobiales bacterium]|nr:hypothetical protein [Acidimicrobiales bacterium]